MPRKYRNSGAAALHVMARIEQVVQPGDTIECDEELSAPFVEIHEDIAQERNAAEPQVNHA